MQQVYKELRDLSETVSQVSDVAFNETYVIYMYIYLVSKKPPTPSYFLPAILLFMAFPVE